MKNLHLVPVNITDIADKLSSSNIGDNERENYLLRLETIKDYCDEIIKKTNTRPTFDIRAKKKSNHR